MADGGEAAGGSTPKGGRHVGFGTRFFYGFGSIAFGVKDNGFAYFLLLFYNQVLGLPAAWVGAGIMSALIIDAITDPVVGYVSDNLHSRLGRRHPFMYASALPVSLAYYMLWSPPIGLEPGELFAYFLVTAVTVRIAITFYEIPSTSLVAELTDDYDERTSMLAYRFFFGWWGGLTMALLAYLVFLPQEMGGVLYREGYRHYGLVASVLMFVAILISAGGTHRHIPNLGKPPPKRPFVLRQILGELKETLGNRSFLVLFVSSLFSAMAAGVSSSLNVYFNTFFWELETSQIGYLTAPLFVAAIFALILAPVLSRWLGKKQAGITIATLALIGAPLPMVLRLLGLFPENGTEALLIALMSMNLIEVTLIIVAGILISSMVADVVEESELRTGRRSEGVFFAARSFAQKAVHGIGTFSATMILAAVEFPRDASPGEVAPEIVRNLALVYIPVLMVVYMIAVTFLTGYKITRASHAETLDELRD
jgi:GPH family glycoside/pentoside/hexuronide:cation symporter